MIPKGFRLNGRRFSPQRLPKIVSDLIAVLDKLPNGELLDVRAAAAAIGRCVNGLNHETANQALRPYRELVNLGGLRAHCLVFGNRKTIAQLRKKLHEDS